MNATHTPGPSVAEAWRHIGRSLNRQEIDQARTVLSQAVDSLDLASERDWKILNELSSAADQLQVMETALVEVERALAGVNLLLRRPQWTRTSAIAPGEDSSQYAP